MDWLLGVTDYKDEDDRSKQLESIGRRRSPILKAENVNRGCLVRDLANLVELSLLTL